MKYSLSNMQALLLLLLVVTLELTHSFQSLKLPSSSRSFSLTQFKQKNEISSKRLQNTELQLLPQIIFAGACAGAVFSYVYNNIDSIKEVSSLSCTH